MVDSNLSPCPDVRPRPPGAVHHVSGQGAWPEGPC